MQYLTTYEMRSVFQPEERDKHGTPKSTVGNYVKIFDNDERFANVYFNEVRNCAEIISQGKNGSFTSKRWDSTDDAKTMYYIESEFGMYSKDKYIDAFRVFLDSKHYNPIKNIVESVEWDGVPRCEEFLIKWGNAEDTPYTREVSRLMFAGGIHRLYNAGCKFEDVPILMGTQGSGKSSLIRYLALNDDYFGELNFMEGQQAIENLQGKWILEIPEMSAFTKAKDQEAIKAFVSRQRDSYRKPYDRDTTEILRTCIFVATTNDLSPLVDKTGNRRWYPVKLHSIGYDVFDNEQEIREYALQCWAEAKAKIDTEEMRPYANRRLADTFLQAQEGAMQDDWRVGAIESFLNRKSEGELTCVREVCHRALSPNPDFPKDPSLVESREIGKILDRLKGWERVQGARSVGIYGNQKCWRKKRTEPDWHKEGGAE